MKTLQAVAVRHWYYLTADDAPASEVAAQWLDRIQRYTGGTRGYGGPVKGQWLKLSKSQYANYTNRLAYAEKIHVAFP